MKQPQNGRMKYTENNIQNTNNFNCWPVLLERAYDAFLEQRKLQNAKATDTASCRCKGLLAKLDQTVQHVFYKIMPLIVVLMCKDLQRKKH